MIPIDRLVLDTSACSHLRSGHPEVLDWVAEAAVVILPATVLGELEAGFELGRRARENRRALAEFLEEPFVSVLDATTATGRHYGRIFAALRRAGKPIPINDVWIAAAAIECRGHLIDVRQRLSWHHYGRAHAVPVVLVANLGLADLAPVLPSGVVLFLPDVAPEAPRLAGSGLWVAAPTSIVLPERYVAGSCCALHEGCASRFVQRSCRSSASSAAAIRG